ncbi:MAG: phosphate ABC transporter ATP-binding protein [Lentisphaerae bacterium]|nr:phosphate ABC transporter ATP-binding protein [Lentisphaerota bacterium]
MSDPVQISVRNLSVYYGKQHVLRGITLDIPSRHVLGIIGPAGSGKTAFLRTLNRLNDLNPDSRMEGKILMGETEITHSDCDVVSLRKRVGMVFALPVPLPLSIYDNLAYGPRLSGIRKRFQLDEIVERSLKAAVLWEEVKDRLQTSAFRLSGGQQQRLCLARVLAMEPEVVLLDEPCSGLDPISTARIEEALMTLKATHTIVLVTNNTKQAARVADTTAFFLMGELIEVGPTSRLFVAPTDSRTNEYISGRFG